MTILMMVLGVALLGAAVWFLLRAGTLPRLHMESHLAHIDGYGAERLSGEVELDGSELGSTSPIARTVEQVGRFIAQSVPSLPRLERKALNAAGIYNVDPDALHGTRVGTAIAAFAVVMAYGVVLSGGISVLLVVIGVGGGALGWELPAQIIRRRGMNRLTQIDKQLPDLIDLLVASVEAGLGVAASLALLADRFDGPLGQEMRFVLQQQRLGTSNAAALTALGERADTPMVRAFSRTLIRADAMGGSIGPVLRNLAADARRRRRQAAAERAQKVPLKLLFPLILFIFPALFIILLFPAGYTILQQFGH